MMRIAILTSVETRHRYFANCLRRRFPVVAIAYEETGYHPASVPCDALSAADKQTVKKHFATRALSEKQFFGHDADYAPAADGCLVRRVSPGTLNSTETEALLDAAGADTIVVYGTSLVRAPLLSRYAGRWVNMHLGLSPYYRGTATNFYPLLDEVPEYVGATIHLLDAGIDSGPILVHARPSIAPGDGPHTIGCKAIQAGIEALIDVLPAWDVGACVPTPQWHAPHARLCLRKDFHPRQVAELYAKLGRGLITRYLQEARQRAARVRLIQWKK